MNTTIEKFGYPETLVHEYEHWVVLLRGQQVTLGSLVLACKEQALSFSTISSAASTELSQAVSDVESVLSATFSDDKINYLMLMMVDPHVHFHVLPRYSSAQKFNDREFADGAWPGPPDLGTSHAISAAEFATLATTLRSRWPSQRNK